jgi:hypothetical protein
MKRNERDIEEQAEYVTEQREYDSRRKSVEYSVVK